MVPEDDSFATAENMSDSILTNMTMPNNTTTVYNGTATITMRQRPVTNVPVKSR
jgi:hypothetical protein